MPAAERTKPSRDVGLVRLLGVIVLLPVVSAAAHLTGPHLAAMALGLVALGAHLAALQRAVAARSVVIVAVLCALMLACGMLAHVLTGQSWALLATAAALVCAVSFRSLAVALIAVVCCTAAALFMGFLGDVTTTLVVVAGPGAVAALRHRLVQTIAELQEAREQLAVAAVREERARFSDDLHDVLGHSLSVIVVAAQLVQRTATEHPDDAREAGRQIETVGRQALDDVRATVLGYRAASFREEADKLAQALRTAGIAPRFADIPELPATVEPVLALVLREAVTNVIRHSHAANCTMTVRADADRVALEVTDDGDGSADAAARAEGGLSSIRSRIAHLGGELAVTTASPHGLQLAVTVPAHEAARR